MQDSIPGFWDQDLSGRQTLNRLSYPGTQRCEFLKEDSSCSMGKESRGDSSSELMVWVKVVAWESACVERFRTES